MPKNLLENPNFEQGQYNDPVIWWTPEGKFTRNFDNILVPSGYVFGWREGFPEIGDPRSGRKIRRPEASVISLSGGFPDPVRVESGDKAFKAHTFHGTHDMGLMQKVQIEEGAWYEFSMFMHSWYSDCSTKPHDPPLLDDCKTRATDSRDYLLVGIDPYGGLDPRAGSVIWSNTTEIYGHYADEPLTVRAQAKTGEITVFAWAVSNYALRHEDVYFDTGSLFKVVENKQYERTVHLPPQDASREEYDSIVDVAFPKKQTISQSVHDAVITHEDLSKRTVHVWDVKRVAGSKEALEDWILERYPPLPELIYHELDQEPQPSELELVYPTTHLPPVITGKYDEWRYNDNTGKWWQHKGLDLKSSWGVWRDEIVCALLGRVSFVGEHPRQGGYGYQVQTMTTLDDERNVRVRYAHLVDGGAYVAEGDIVHANDKIGKPDNTGNSTGDHLHIDVQVDGVYVDPEPLIEWPTDEPEPEPTKHKTHLTGHMQTMEKGWKRFCTPPGQALICKVMASQQDILGVTRASNGKTRGDYRLWRAGYDEILGAQTAEEGAKTWIEYHGDSLHTICDTIEAEFPSMSYPLCYIEFINEMCSSSDVETMEWVFKIGEAYCYELQKYDKRLGPIVFNAAVGNPFVEHYPLLEDLARAAINTGGLFGYHRYYLADRVEEDGPWLAMRNHEMDDVLRAKGLKVTWFATECGPVGGRYIPDTQEFNAARSQYNLWAARHPQTAFTSVGGITKPRTIFIPRDDPTPDRRLMAATGGGYVLLPNDGWKSNTCYNGDWEACLRTGHMEFDRLCDEWNRTHEGRDWGGAIFTSGQEGLTNWGSFIIKEPHIIDIEAAMKQRYG